jgi:hypothetical protein
LPECPSVLNGPGGPSIDICKWRSIIGLPSGLLLSISIIKSNRLSIFVLTQFVGIKKKVILGKNYINFPIDGVTS